MRFKTMFVAVMLVCALGVARVSAKETQPITDEQLLRATATCEAQFKDAMETLRDVAVRTHVFETKYPNRKNEIRLQQQAVSDWINLHSSLFRLHVSIAIRVADTIRTKSKTATNMTDAMLLKTTACPRIE